MTYDDYKLATPEEGKEIPCERCGTYFPADEIHYHNGLPYCEGHYHDAIEDDLLYNYLECDCCGESWHKDSLKSCDCGDVCVECMDKNPAMAVSSDNYFKCEPFEDGYNSEI